MNDLVSIIVPIYKVEPYLRRCLDSIVNQTYTNLEIILVDDGSPDKCPQICDEYAANDNRIIVIHKENGGLSDARNTGLDVCKGEYIYFIDGDDFIDLETIDLLVSQSLEANADITIAGYSSFEQPSKHSSPLKKSPFREISFDEAMQMQVFGHPKFTQIVVAWNKLIQREIATKYRFPKGKICEDNYTTYKYFFDSKKTIISDIPLYFYQIRKNSIVSQLYQTVKNEIITIEYTREKINFLRKLKKNKLANLFFKKLGDYELFFYYSLKSDFEKKQLLTHFRSFSCFRHPFLSFALHHPDIWKHLAYFKVNSK
jgi:glycosyltransferase involved in cell wall biosynthesis